MDLASILTVFGSRFITAIAMNIRRSIIARTGYPKHAQTTE